MRSSSTATASRCICRTPRSAPTRRGNDWTNRFKKVAADAWHINAGSAIIDREIVVPAADGTTEAVRAGDFRHILFQRLETQRQR
jgi:ATP-dependent DNA ligase